jgi:cation diffusion facilitator CzcD-associated flavoprotein CzcO
MPSVRELSSISIPLSNTTAFAPSPPKLRVVTIGAGFSGLIFAHKLQHERPELSAHIEHVIYEKNGAIGGTWLENEYPGVQNDVPA